MVIAIMIDVLLTRRDAMLSFSCVAATALVGELQIEKIDLFRAADGDLVTQKGTVLAFCEARKGTAND